MNTYVILATGPSLTQEAVDYVKDKAKVIAISNAFKLAPWADALVSHDYNWWTHNKEAFQFSGKKFCALGTLPGVKTHKPKNMPGGGCNSGLMGMYIAAEMGAKKIILLGFDMHGSHFFGEHPKPLKNTNAARFKVHLNQFNSWANNWAGVEVINCTPNSSLKKFPFKNLTEVL